MPGRPFSLALLSATLALAAASPLYAAPRNADRVRIEYVPPTNPAHRAIHDAAKRVGVIEYVKVGLSAVRLPRVLSIRLAGCNGESNAYYKGDVITVCYEYIDEIIAYAPEQPLAWGLTRADVIAGPLMDVFMHEVAHALFDMLGIPVLGREEDAADQFSTQAMLQLDKARARKLILGTAYQYVGEMRQFENTLAASKFANEHGNPAQRFFNLLCMAYGADPVLFADLVDRGYLPEDRAEGCEHEYDQARYSLAKLISPFVDKRMARRFAKKKRLR